MKGRTCGAAAMNKYVGASLALGLALVMAQWYVKWSQHEQLGLAPRGGGMIKDFLGYALISLPGLARKLKAAPSYAELEDFAVNKKASFNSFAQSSKFTESPFFTENFYFWANSRGHVGYTRFLFTVRLSFYGANASKVVPWFHFKLGDQVWNLPSEFADLVPARAHNDPIHAVTPLGTIRFTCIDPMRKWRIQYDGTLENLSSLERRRVNADFLLDFNPKSAHMYQLHWDPVGVSRAMAAKRWDAAFWANLRAQNQERHCNQARGGRGKVVVYAADGETVEVEEEIEVDGSEDRNKGIRQWRFIWRYIWWPPVKFHKPLVVEGVPYIYLAGAFTEYGNTFENVVVGGMMSDDGEAASFSGATPMRDIAPKWYDAQSAQGIGIGETTLPGELNFKIGILDARYYLDIKILRGRQHGLWQHSFLMEDGIFEIHEGQSKWFFKVKRATDHVVVAEGSADGLFEFGANLVGMDIQSN